MRNKKVAYVFFVFFVSIFLTSASARAQDVGDPTIKVDSNINLVIDQDLGASAGTYTVVPVEDLPVNADGKVFVPQGTTESMSDTQLVVTIVRTVRLGEWMILALAITQALIRLLKRKEVTQMIMPKYGTLVVLTLCAVSALLSALVADMNPVEAVLIFVLTGLPKWVHDMRLEWKRIHQLPDLQEESP